jgi:hypothetical protein
MFKSTVTKKRMSDLDLPLPLTDVPSAPEGMEGGTLILLVFGLLIVVYAAYKYITYIRAQHKKAVEAALTKKLLAAGITKYGREKDKVHVNNIVCTPSCGPMGECVVKNGVKSCQCQFPFSGKTCRTKFAGWQNEVSDVKLSAKAITVNRYGCQVLKEPSTCSFLRAHNVDPYAPI